MFFISGTSGPKICQERLSMIPSLWFGLGFFFVLFCLERKSKIMNVKNTF